MMEKKSMLLENLKKKIRSKSKIQQNAWDILEGIGLPHKKSEAYRYTPITSILEKKVDLNLIGNNTDSIENQFYNTKGNHLVIKNGVFQREKSTIENDLTIESQGISEGLHDPFSLLNTAFGVEEISLEIKKSISPIFIYHFNSIGFSNPRIKVTVQEGQEISIFEKHANISGGFSNAYLQFDLARNSSTNYTKIQNYASDVYAHETIVAHQARDSKFYSNTFSFSGGLIRNNIMLALEDENCECHMYGLYVLDNTTHVDNNTSVDHTKPNSFSNELYKGILDERSTGVFNGKIYVRPEAQKTNAFQTNNNILLSDDATVNTKPQLEIWADDVKCSHGCTSGQLNEEAVFYLRTRGISERNAKAMILNAFASETLRNVKNDEVKEELELLIKEKLV